MRVITPILNGIKTAAIATANFFLRVVTAGRYGVPRAKKAEPHIIDEKAIAERQAEAKLSKEAEVEKLMTFLGDDADGFKASPEFEKYNEAMADAKNYANPFLSVKTFYQEYKAKGFLDKMGGEEQKLFKLSSEYHSYLQEDPMNPFSKSMDEIHKGYTDRINADKGKKAEAEQIKKNMTDFYKFMDEIPEIESRVKMAFASTDEYTDMTKNLENDPTLKLDKTKGQYEAFRKRISEKNESFLRELKDRAGFEASDEYKKATEGEMILTKTLKNAHAQYGVRIKEEGDRKAFVQELKDKKVFDDFEASGEYKSAARNPFDSATANELKIAFNTFEIRNFLAGVDPDDLEMLKEMPETQKLMSNPFYSVDDLKAIYSELKAKHAVFEKMEEDGNWDAFQKGEESKAVGKDYKASELREAYDNFNKREISEYLDGIKTQHGDAVLEAFYNSVEYNTGIGLDTRELVEDAFSQYETQHYGWLGWS